ncbi:chromate transporter [Treponema phagedenis]|uniref:Chromate transport protein n=1 Tax=Treponema phagedenis TaxID=162 RepID=A0A0B7GTP7_TREPH|nr:chromate transporter [Treponema phagedenis]EFW37591.1 chromate transport protein [Treponema phagedenis F0421]NVP24874.1 chromate transporter [Treponema phagedenis]QEJ96016.1 chromate transporter [Treponema phagedenis]QKS93209.1 chromate transporter [Treponema phagedenis]QLC59049.1 chromate transporter [Treponema phagedenis]
MTIKEKLKILHSLFWAFFKIGSVTFGGGIAMLPILKRDLVDDKKWLTEEEIIDYFAIGQCTPGIIAVNVATFSGYKRLGLLGAIIATVGIVTPSIIVITIIAAFISNFQDIVWVQKAFKGINVAVAMLLIRAVYDFGRKTVFDIATFAIAAAAFIAMAMFNVSGIIIVLCSGLLGYVFQYFKVKAEGGEK